MASQMDDLSDTKRKALVRGLRRCIKMGLRSDQDKYWNIPRCTKEQATLRSYGFPTKNPVIWFAMTGFPEINTTRDAFLIAHSIKQPITTVFEFNVGVTASNRLNIRLQDGGDNRVLVRCMPSFAFKGAVRQPAWRFYDFVRVERIALALETYGKRTFVRLPDIPWVGLDSDWPRVWRGLADFAEIVSQFKKWAVKNPA